MFNKMFSQVNLLERGLDAASLRQQAIAQNMANVDTPNYKSKRVVFEESLREAYGNQAGSFKALKSDPRHIDFNASDPSDVYPSVVTNDHYTMRMDGNNVDPDYEMVELAKNTIQYDLLITKMNGEFNRLKMAVREGR